ncbi:MAG TPA: hypothetical protein EYO58_09915 [Flavobacteriales bacterium]|nr:hypothetical protein [Flavobacteriales bacterium]
MEGAVEILETTTSLYFVRAAVAAESKSASAVMQFGTCPAVAVSGGNNYFGEGSAEVDKSGYGVSANLYIKLNGYDNAGNKLYTSNRSFAITSSLSDGLATTIKESEGEFLAFRKVFGGELDSGKQGAWAVNDKGRSPFIVAPFAGPPARPETALKALTGVE